MFRIKKPGCGCIYPHPYPKSDFFRVHLCCSDLLSVLAQFPIMFHIQKIFGLIFGVPISSHSLSRNFVFKFRSFLFYALYWKTLSWLKLLIIVVGNLYFGEILKINRINKIKKSPDISKIFKFEKLKNT